MIEVQRKLEASIGLSQRYLQDINELYTFQLETTNYAQNQFENLPKFQTCNCC